MNCFQKRSIVKRLGKKRNGALCEGDAIYPRVIPAGHHDNWGGWCNVVKQPLHFQTIELRHPDVDDCQGNDVIFHVLKKQSRVQLTTRTRPGTEG